jgi:hypothetical protein
VLHAAEHLGPVVYVHRRNHHGERRGHDRGGRDAAHDRLVNADSALDADGVEHLGHSDSLLELLVRQGGAGERREVQLEVVDTGALLARGGVGDRGGLLGDAGQPAIERSMTAEMLATTSPTCAGSAARSARSPRSTLPGRAERWPNRGGKRRDGSHHLAVDAKGFAGGGHRPQTSGPADTSARARRAASGSTCSL